MRIPVQAGDRRNDAAGAAPAQEPARSARRAPAAATPVGRAGRPAGVSRGARRRRRAGRGTSAASIRVGLVARVSTPGTTVSRHSGARTVTAARGDQSHTAAVCDLVVRPWRPGVQQTSTEDTEHACSGSCVRTSSERPRGVPAPARRRMWIFALRSSAGSRFTVRVHRRWRSPAGGRLRPVRRGPARWPGRWRRRASADG